MPYNREQIKQVLMQRLQDADASHLFEESAIQLVSMRIAGTSGDIRKALQILRRAIELRKSDGLISGLDTQRAQDDLFQNKFVQAIATLQLIPRRSLLCLYQELERGSLEATTVRKVWLRFDTLINQKHAPAKHYRPITFKDFANSLNMLENTGLIIMKPLTKQSFEEFKGAIDADENITKQALTIKIDTTNDDDEDGALTVSERSSLDFQFFRPSHSTVC